MFEYLGVLISVILGLALTHLLRGLAKLIHMRRSVKPYWVHIVWTINMLIYVLAIWWGMFWWNRLEVWTIERFFFIAAYASVLFMLASMLYPPEVSPDLNCEEYFYANRTWFFGLQLVAFLIDVPETLAKGVSHLRGVPREYVVFLPTILIICLIGLRSSNRRVHAALCLLWLFATMSYLTLTAIDRVVVR
jgi:uncharacterized membrane protein YfhO